MAPERVCLAYSGVLTPAPSSDGWSSRATRSSASLPTVVRRRTLTPSRSRLRSSALSAMPSTRTDTSSEPVLLALSLLGPWSRSPRSTTAQFSATDYLHLSSQVRFELAWKACDPTLKVLAPWRMPEFYNRFAGRADLLKFASEQNIPVSSTPKAPWSMDDNIIHCSYEAGILEQTELEPPKDMWKRTVDPMKAPDEPTPFVIHFEQGVPVKLEVAGKTITGSLEIFKEANEIGRINGIGRVDIVESRFIGLKSRGCYDTPGLTILRQAHIDLEGLVLDSKVRAIRDRLTQDWSACIYNGMYFSPERELVEHAIKFSQRQVEGKVSLVAYKGNAYVVGRSSETSNLYSEDESSMDTLDMNWTPQDTTGFIAIQGIRLEKYGARKIKDGEPLAP
uniref:Argininosuccinate synthase n=1 Tax=Gibberella zeae (strain ATCC MYA-4620 / CBS 123657 / FGSC 9075 / NRRL 31084 / PH-1) TaxID=229533 RepID=A0A098D5E8_GIBZE